MYFSIVVSGNLISKIPFFKYNGVVEYFEVSQKNVVFQYFFIAHMNCFILNVIMYEL